MDICTRATNQNKHGSFWFCKAFFTILSTVRKWTGQDKAKPIRILYGKLLILNEYTARKRKLSFYKQKLDFKILAISHYVTVGSRTHAAHSHIIRSGHNNSCKQNVRDGDDISYMIIAQNIQLFMTQVRPYSTKHMDRITSPAPFSNLLITKRRRLMQKNYTFFRD